MRPSLKHCLTLAALIFATQLCCSCSPEAKKASHLKKADAHLAHGRYDEAEIEYLNVLQVDNRNAAAIAQLAIIYSDQGRIAKVFPYLLKAKELQPENTTVRLKLGMLQLALGNTKGAIEEASFVLDRRPDDPDAPLLLADASTTPETIAAARKRLQGLAQGTSVQVALGTLELKERHLPEGETILRRAVEQDPKSDSAQAALGLLFQMKNNLSQAELAFKQASELARPRSPRQLAYARFKLQTGDADAARRAVEGIVAKTPDYLPPQISLAELLAAQKKFQESAALLAKVLARDPGHIEALLTSSRLKLAQGENEQAVAELEKTIKLYPKLPVAYYQLALACIAKGDTQKAIGSLNQVLALAPGNPDATLLLAEFSFRRGDAKSAVGLLKPLLQQRPDLPQARLLLADAYRSQGNFTEALAIYQKLEESTPRNPQPAYGRGLTLLQQKNPVGARAAFNRALEITPDFLPALEQLINLALSEKDFATATSLVQKQIARDPKQSGSYLLQAKIFLAQNDSTKAEAALHQAIELQPDSSAAYLLLGRLYASSNQIDKALANFQSAVSKNPKNIEALMMIGTLSEKKRDFTGARDAYEKLLILNPRFSPALNNLAYLYSENFNQMDRAQELARKAKDLLPHEPHTADTLGWILYRQQQYPWALTQLQESAGKLPDSAEIQYHLGMTHYMLGNESSAREALERALQLEKDFAGADEARLALSILDFDLRSAGPGGIAKLEKTASDRPGDPVLLGKLASAYAANGTPEKAIETYQNVLQKNPNNLAVTMALVRTYASRHETAKAFDLAKAARKIAPDDPTVAFALGRLAYESRDYTWAASLLAEASQKMPGDIEALYAVGEAAYAVGKVADAESAMRQVAEAQPAGARSESARHFLTMNTLASNPEPGGVAQIEQTLKITPDYVPALMVRAVFQVQRGGVTAAKATYEKVLTIFPGFAPAKKQLAIFYASNPADDKVAYALAASAREALPDDAELAKAFGIITYRTGDFTHAASLLQESAAGRSSDPEVFYYLGASQAKLKQRSESQKSLKRALELKLKPDLAGEAQRLLKE